MNGIVNLNELLKNLNPIIEPDEYVYIHNSGGTFEDKLLFARINEDEGETVVLKKKLADELHLSYESTFARITLKVHSSLNAVGLTAAVSNALAKKGISCNMIAGYFHDHIFIPMHQGEEALRILNSLSN